ncbi:MAG: cytochrome d ubiquinol oxidase subunit II [Solirubrobacteraceae bacterium]
MFLDTLPLVFVLAGVVLYTVLSGADFGAGMWRLWAGGGKRGERIRDHAHHSMGPVWEANHVWLIFVLTVTWTAYPVFFGSVASTLSVALFIAALGIILRGASYALRSGAAGDRELRMIDAAFAVASLVTPFALGAAAGGIAADRVPVGNAAGDLFTSWLNPTSILIGALAVAFSAYLAAIFLAADAARAGEPDLVEAFRVRALAAGMAAGGLALAGLIVLHGDDHSLYSGLVHGSALVVLIVSVLVGTATLALDATRRFELARYTAAVAVALVIADWLVARYPSLLPGLTIHQAAASHSTMICLVVAVLAGGALLFPALGLLFSLTLRGRLGQGGAVPTEGPAASAAVSPLRRLGARPSLDLRIAAALLIIGIGMLNAASAPWAHAVGVVSLFGFVLVGFAAVIPRALAEDA